MGKHSSHHRVSAPHDKSQYHQLDVQEKAPFFAVSSPSLRQALAECYGTFILVLFGVGVNNEVNLNDNTRGGWLSVTIGWGVAIMLGVLASASVSGAHLNPAVTIAMAWFGNLPWKKVPGYIVGQLVGAFLGALCVYVMYKPLYDIVDPERTKLQGAFATYPAANIPNSTAFYTEFIATAMLVAGVMSLGDKKNRAVSNAGAPLVVALLIWGIGMSFGSNSGYALNPARDLGPRLVTALFGWGFKVFTLSDWYFWIPIVAPVLGGIFGGYLYKLAIENHHPRKIEVEEEP